MYKPCTAVRDRLVQRRTALINEIRGFLLERGITFAATPIHLRRNLPTLIKDAEQNLSPRLRWLLERMWQEWKQLEIDIKAITEEIERISNEDSMVGSISKLEDKCMCWFSAEHTNGIAEAKAGQRLGIKQMNWHANWVVCETELGTARPTPVCLIDQTKVLFRFSETEQEPLHVGPKPRRFSECLDSQSGTFSSSRTADKFR